jgi:DNA-binding Lrp family transcriptional regulator
VAGPSTHSRPDDEPVARAALDDGTLERHEMRGEVIGYAPLVDYDAVDARTVLVRLRVAPDDVGAVASDIADAGGVSVFELTGRVNLLAVCRFPDDAQRERFLAGLATDDRINDVTVSVALRTVVEGDARGLL